VEWEKGEEGERREKHTPACPSHLVFTSICISIADTGKILVLPVLYTILVIPVLRPAASYYPKSLLPLI
jgi:hypothetical protein